MKNLLQVAAFDSRLNEEDKSIQDKVRELIGEKVSINFFQPSAGGGSFSKYFGSLVLYGTVKSLNHSLGRARAVIDMHDDQNVKDALIKKALSSKMGTPEDYFIFVSDKTTILGRGATLDATASLQKPLIVHINFNDVLNITKDSWTGFTGYTEINLR